MIKGSSVLGKPVLSRADGEKLDSVKDVILGTDRTHVIALLLSEGNIFSKPTVVPIENVVSFGKDAVVITDSQAVVRADHVPAVTKALEIDQRLSGRKVFSESGDQYGKLDDIHFDDKTGEILGVDVTGVGEGSATKKVGFVDKENLISFGEDALVISTIGASKLVEQTGQPAGGARAAAAAGATNPGMSQQEIEMAMPSMATTDAPAAVARVSEGDSGLGGATEVLPADAGDEGTGPQTVG
jgi:uncharacterized protein YrrD